MIEREYSLKNFAERFRGPIKQTDFLLNSSVNEVILYVPDHFDEVSA